MTPHKGKAPGASRPGLPQFSVGTGFGPQAIPNSSIRRPISLSNAIPSFALGERPALDLGRNLFGILKGAFEHPFEIEHVASAAGLYGRVVSRPAGTVLAVAADVDVPERVEDPIDVSLLLPNALDFSKPPVQSTNSAAIRSPLEFGSSQVRTKRLPGTRQSSLCPISFAMILPFPRCCSI